MLCLKGIVTWLSFDPVYSIRYNELEAGKFFHNLMIKSHERSGLRISGMALYNQSDLQPFFSPQKVNLKIGLNSEDELPRKKHY